LALDLYILAMSYHRLGEAERARDVEDVFSGRFASTAVEDVALSSEPTVTLRASVRRHRRILWEYGSGSCPVRSPHGT
jgi:hypothetical protein